jgi:hypothetical protein
MGLPEGPPRGVLDGFRAAQTMTSAGDGEALDLTALTVDSHSFTLERRSMVLLLQLAPGADRCGAEPVRRAVETIRARTPPWPGKGRRAAGGAQARNVSPDAPPGDSCCGS